MIRAVFCALFTGRVFCVRARFNDFVDRVAFLCFCGIRRYIYFCYICLYKIDLWFAVSTIIITNVFAVGIILIRTNVKKRVCQGWIDAST